MEHSNYLPKSHHGCNLRCIWLYVLLQKYPRVEFFIGSLLQMLKANDFDRDGCRTFIVQFPCRKMKTSMFSQIISKKITSSETLRGKYCICFPAQAFHRRSLNLWIDSLCYWLQSLHRQSVFLTCFNPRINLIFYITAVWLPHGQLRAIIEGTASLN